jgi:hypothetical protein
MTTIISGSNGLTFPDSSTQAVGFYGFKNRIINGAMVIDQRNAGASITPTASPTYTVDRWAVELSVASKFSVQQNAGAVTPPVGFKNYLGFTSLSAYSVSSTDYFFLDQKIEGFNFADMAWGTASAQPITISCWVRSSLTGTFGGVLYNASGNRSYPFTYTISSANTWEQKSITIAGDQSGTWATDNSTAVNVIFSLGAGSTASGTAGSWSGSLYRSATGATSVVGTSSATFYITGVQLEKGSTATSFDYRPYGTELALCQRYCVVYGGSGNYDVVGLGFATSTTVTNANTIFPVEMRSAPSLTVTGSWQNSDGVAATAISALAVLGASMSNKTGVISGTSASGLTAYRPYRIEAANSTASKTIFSAEL